MTSKDSWRSDISDVCYRVPVFVEGMSSTRGPFSMDYTCVTLSAGRSIQIKGIFAQANLFRYSLAPPVSQHHGLLVRLQIHVLSTTSHLYIKFIMTLRLKYSSQPLKQKCTRQTRASTVGILRHPVQIDRRASLR